MTTKKAVVHPIDPFLYRQGVVRRVAARFEVKDEVLERWAAELPGLK